jgi:hypothetical protein
MISRLSEERRAPQGESRDSHLRVAEQRAGVWFVAPCVCCTRFPPSPAAREREFVRCSRALHMIPSCIDSLQAANASSYGKYTFVL